MDFRFRDGEGLDNWSCIPLTFMTGR